MAEADKGVVETSAVAERRSTGRRDQWRSYVKMKEIIVGSEEVSMGRVWSEAALGPGQCQERCLADTVFVVC